MLRKRYSVLFIILNKITYIYIYMIISAVEFYPEFNNYVKFPELIHVTYRRDEHECYIRVKHRNLIIC